MVLKMADFNRSRSRLIGLTLAPGEDHRENHDDRWYPHSMDSTPFQADWQDSGRRAQYPVQTERQLPHMQLPPDINNSREFPIIRGSQRYVGNVLTSGNNTNQNARRAMGGTAAYEPPGNQHGTPPVPPRNQTNVNDSSHVQIRQSINQNNGRNLPQENNMTTSQEHSSSLQQHEIQAGTTMSPIVQHHSQLQPIQSLPRIPTQNVQQTPAQTPFLSQITLQELWNNQQEIWNFLRNWTQTVQRLPPLEVRV